MDASFTYAILVASFNTFGYVYGFNSIMLTLLFNRRLCCATIKSLFTNEGKHGGQATVEAVRLIADHIKAHDCQLHPDSVEVQKNFLSCF